MPNSPQGPVGKCAGESRLAHVFDTRSGDGAGAGDDAQKSAGPPPGPPPSPPAPVPAARPAAAPVVGKLNLADQISAVNAFAQLGLAMTTSVQADGTVELKQAQNEFSALLSDCAGHACRSINLSACYATSQATDDLMTQWNKRFLYGRAYLSADGKACVNDIVPLPADGLDPSALQAALDIYRDVRVSFFKFANGQ